MTEDPRAQLAKTRLGQVLKGKWQLESLIGFGSMAAVYAATHRNGKRVAVKMLHPEMAADPDVKERFLREGYAANKVEHSGCVSVIDDDTSEDGSVYIVMELLRGETLQARADKHGGKLPLGEVIVVADQLLDVLASAHDKGIVHRDLKPDNLFLTVEGQLKVLDFGIARLRETKKQIGSTLKESLMGTPAFMPPEQALAEWDKVDGRSDLWAAGATFFNLLTGRLVHEADNVTALLLAISTKPVAPIASVLSTIPPSIATVIDRSLSLDRSDRYQDARAMQAALRKAVADLPPGMLDLTNLASESGPMSFRPFGSPSIPPPAFGASGGTFNPSSFGVGALRQKRVVPIAVIAGLLLVGAIVLAIFLGKPAENATASQAPSGEPVATAAPAQSAETAIDLGDLDEPGTASSGGPRKKGPRKTTSAAPPPSTAQSATPAPSDAPSAKKPTLKDTLNQFD